VITLTLFWFCAAVLLAALEIEIEGKFGWAEKLPTWYRTTGAPARIFGLLSSGKPLTGYHLFLQALLLLFFHVPFIYGAEWNAPHELQQIAFFILFWLMEDFAWFILNPNYGIGQFRQDRVWWFAKSRWIGRLPLDYVAGSALVLSLFTGACMLMGAMLLPALLNAALQLVFVLLLQCFVFVLAPFYRVWYHFMRTTDDRDKAGIFHRD
jgi:hypothetical protein